MISRDRWMPMATVALIVCAASVKYAFPGLWPSVTPAVLVALALLSLWSL